MSVEDANGNVVTSDNSNVAVAIGTNPGGGTLGGTLTSRGGRGRNVRQPVDQQARHGLHADGGGREPERRHLGHLQHYGTADGSAVSTTAAANSRYKVGERFRSRSPSARRST